MEKIAHVESLDYEGRGVAHVEGKTIFIEGALPFEKVSYSSFRKKPSFENAHATAIHQSSFLRVTPGCEYFGICGGCSMQHVDATAQVAVKQRVLEDNLARIGKIKPEMLYPAIYGPTWHYRHRARISARFVSKKGTMLIGFHERRSSFVADMKSCKILPQHVSDLLYPLRELIGSLSIYQAMPQIELAEGAEVTVLVLRTMQPLTGEDEEKLKAFVDQHADRCTIQFWLQPKGPDSAHPFYPLEAPALNYRLPEFNLTMPYRPTEFTQVNPAINSVMVSRAMKLLDPQPNEKIGDFFCGLGNFTLPIARLGATVLGMEGSAQLVARAQESAQVNGLADQTTFEVANLFEMNEARYLALPAFDKILIDPPRDGAVELVTALGVRPPKRIVYVSCNPATLARDAAVLIHEHGYTLKGAGIINMFPHTAHVESIACFEKN